METTTTKLTVKQLSAKISIAEGTIRAWIMKPIDGIPYDKNNINYNNLIDKLTKYFPEFTETFGFAAKDLEIVQAERTTKKWLAVDDRIKELQVGTKITLHNYSLKTDMTYCGFHYDTNSLPNIAVLIFKTDKNEYKAYSEADLDKTNIKLELAQ